MSTVARLRRLMVPLVMALGSAQVAAAPEVPRVPTSPVAPPKIADGGVAPAPSNSSIYDRAAPSVVLIFCEVVDAASGKTGTSSGSGSILSKDGSILTNFHVIESAKRCFAILKPPGQDTTLRRDTPNLPLRIVAADPAHDLALVRMTSPQPGLPVLALGNLDEVKVGDAVHAIGHPKGLYWSYTNGVVSQVRRGGLPGVGMEGVDVVQTQAPISSGNSGGPLLSSDGRLIGVNTAVLFPEKSQNLNIAVAVSEVQRFLVRAERGELRPPAAPTTAAAPAPADAGRDCAEKLVSEQRSKSSANPGLLKRFEIGCAGWANAVLFVPDDKTHEPILYVATQKPVGDREAVYDMRFYLDPKSGRVLRSWHDRDGDGHPDYVGIHRDGSASPSEFIRFTPNG